MRTANELQRIMAWNMWKCLQRQNQRKAQGLDRKHRQEVRQKLARIYSVE